MDTHTSLPQTEVGDVPPLQGNGELVLVVDDNKPLRRLANLVLSKNGYQVLEAPSAQAALDLLTAEAARCSLLLTDILMPEMDGFTLVREARELNPSLKFLMMTGTYTFPDIEGALFALGVADLLHKPFTGPDLLKGAHSALRADT